MDMDIWTRTTQILVKANASFTGSGAFALQMLMEALMAATGSRENMHKARGFCSPNSR